MNPTYVDWIFVSGADIFQHQNGWEWFRQEAWLFPLGSISAFGYPFGTTVSFTDSIPLFAFLFKLLDPLLPGNFQYLGMWVLLSTIGQFFFGLLILGEFTSSSWKKILGASLLVLSPVLINRVFYHNSLTAQWILLAGFWFTGVEYRRGLWRGAWVTLFPVSLLVHLYFAAMLIPFWALSQLFRYKREKRIKPLLIDTLLLIAVMVGIGYAIGLFSLSVGDLLGEGYGFYSWNLNGFINPGKYSAFLAELPVGSEGQAEGYSYLGLGNLLLLPLAIFYVARREKSHHNKFLAAAVVLISVLFTLFALSNRAFFNSHLLWDFRFSKKIEIALAFFRASGRFIWPVFYLIVLFSLSQVIRGSRFAIAILLLAVLLQFFDLQPLYSSRRVPDSLVYQSPLKSEFWAAAASENKHVLLLPAAKAHMVYEPFALFARKNKLTINWGYFSRANLGGIKEYGEQNWADILAGNADGESLFVFWDPEWTGFADGDAADWLVVCQVDGYTVGVSPNNTLVRTGGEFLRNCSFPR